MMHVTVKTAARSWSSAGILKSIPGFRSLDTRLMAMLVVLAGLWLMFDLLTGGIFLSARNLYNLSLQVAVVAIMTSGMILVIVTRNIDLSVGSQVGFIGVLGGLVQTVYMVPGGPNVWWVSCLAMLGAGFLIGAIQGGLIAYARIPSFVVTLGGLLFFRNAAYQLYGGTTIAPLDPTYKIIGGGMEGTIGATWSWIVGGAAMLLIVFSVFRSVARRSSVGLGKPEIAGATVGVVVWAVVIFGFVAVMNSYDRPGTSDAMGIAVPVLVLIAVTLFVNAIATKHRFGRHIFAVGGNPESAKLAGVPSRWVVMRVYILMGVLAALASIVLTARLGAAASGSGTMMELYVIAAAVIGGTSLAGGAGTIIGGIVGALIMQTLQSGMVLMGIPSPMQSMIAAVVLVLAVWIDTLWRRRVV